MQDTKLGNNPKYGRENRPMNEFGRWCVSQGFEGPDVDAALGWSANTAYTYMRPVDHPLFSVPRPPRMAQIFAFTKGAIGPAAFYDVEGWRKQLAEKAAA